MSQRMVCPGGQIDTPSLDKSSSNTSWCAGGRTDGSTGSHLRLRSPRQGPLSGPLFGWALFCRGSCVML